MLIRLHRLTVHCADLKRSVAFYRDVLGFPLKFEFADRAEFHSGPVTLVLRPDDSSESGTMRKEPARAGETRLEFEVLDLEKFCREKSEKGAEIISPLEGGDSQNRTAVLHDPDGLAIFVTEAS